MVGKDVEQELCCPADGNANSKATLWKTIWRFLIKLNAFSLYNPAIKFLHIYPEELETYNHTEIAHTTWLLQL